jgi:hypothetical protein
MKKSVIIIGLSLSILSACGVRTQANESRAGLASRSEATQVLVERLKKKGPWYKMSTSRLELSLNEMDASDIRFNEIVRGTKAYWRYKITSIVPVSPIVVTDVESVQRWTVDYLITLKVTTVTSAGEFPIEEEKKWLISTDGMQILQVDPETISPRPGMLAEYLFEAIPQKP